MINTQRNIKYEIINKNESQSQRGNIIPKINLNIKSLKLPIINSNACYSERIPFNTTKKIIKNSKEEKKIGNKYELKNKENKETKIKYLTLKKENNEDNILFLLRNIKIKNDSNIKQKNDTKIKIKKKHINRNIDKNNYKTPKKLRTILINEPNLTYNNIYLNTNVENKIKGKKEENKYSSMKTEIDQNKTKDNKTIIHNIFFKWAIDNIKLNNSYDLSMSSLSSKNLFKNIKIKHNNGNKIIKSADISQKNNNTKTNIINYKEIFFENKIKNILYNNIKMINKENIDKNFINTKMFNNLLNTLSRNHKLNKSKNKIYSNINFKSSSKLVNNNNNFKNYLLENGDNFLSKFLKKLMRKNKKNNKEIEQNKIKENTIKKNSFPIETYSTINKNEIKNEEIINDDNEKQENKSLENSDIRKKHYNIILISSPGKIAKEKKETNRANNTIIKNTNNKYQNQNSIRMNKKVIIDDNKKLINSYKEKDNFLVNYEENIKIKSSLENLYKNNSFNIGEINKNIYSDRSINGNKINIMNNNNKSKIKINSDIIDKLPGEDIIQNKYEKNDQKEVYHYNNKNEDASQIDNLNTNYDKIINNNISDENDNLKYNINNNNNFNNNINTKSNIYININNDIKDIINNGIITNINNNKDINIIIKDNINHNINDNIIHNKKINDNKKIIHFNNNKYFSNEKSNDNLLLFSDNKINNNNNNNIYNDTKEKEMNNIENVDNNIKNINLNKSHQKDKKEIINNNIYINNKSRSQLKKGSLLIKVNRNENQEIRKKRRSTYINPYPKKIIKRNKDIFPIRNITEANKQINKSTLSGQISDNDNKDKSSISHNSSEKDDIVDFPSKGNKQISELDKILFKKKSKSKPKKIKKKKKKEKNEKQDEKKGVNEDKDEFKYLNTINEKQKNFQDINGTIDLMNYNENDFIINNESEMGTNKSLTKEDMNKLLIYSKKLRELSELKEKNIDKVQSEELIVQIKEIKEKYDLILNKYIMNQKYKNLTKINNQKPNFKLNKKFFKFYFKENNNNEERLLESEHEINIEDNKPPQYSNDVRSEKENSESEEKNEKENIKKLIYDNSYMFKKEKKEKKIEIKKEVLDILNLESNFNTKNNEINIKNNSSNIKMNIYIRKRNKNKNYRKFRKTYLPRKKQINFNTNFNKLSLFTDINEEKIEKINDEENEKEKLLEHKLKIFFNDIQNLKKNLIDMDHLDFIKKENNKRKEYMTRLNEFNKNINNLQIKDKKSKYKLNFLSPIQFKTKNL